MTTNPTRIIPALLLCTMWLLPCRSNAQQDNTEVPAVTVKNNAVTVTAEINYMRHYLWRGILFGSNDVSQPSINIQYRHFFIKPGVNLNLVKKNLPKEFYKKPVMYDEQDIEAGYSNSIGKLDYEIKLMAYFYFNQINSPSTSEMGFSLGYPIAKNISLHTETAIDIRAYKGGFYNSTFAAWEYSIKQNDFAIQAGLSMGNKKFTDAYLGAEVPGLLFWSGRAAFTHNMKNCYLTISGDYNVYSSKAVKEAAGVSTTDNFTITLGRNFGTR
jgi:hypothetical protein